MRKKYLSALLFGALLFASAGTFTSCKDYDDDIANLQGQIDKKADLSSLTEQVTEMQTAVSAAKESAENSLAKAEEALAAAQKAASTDEVAKLESEIASLKEKITKLESTSVDLEALKNELKEAIASSLEADFDTLKKEVEDQLKVVKELAGSFMNMVTEVDVYYKAGQDDNSTAGTVTFSNVTTKKNTFGPNGEIVFADDVDIQTAGELVVRVVPSTAELTPSMISLINGKGESIMDKVTVESVEPYSELLTTRASKTGLWKIKFTLNKYNKNEFDAIKKTQDGDILYAVSVTSGVSVEEDETSVVRAAISDYAVTLDYLKGAAANQLMFKVDGTSVAEIHNRFSASEKSLDNTSNITDYVWKDAAATAIAKDKSNVIDKADRNYNDKRQNKNCLNVEVGVPFKITLDQLAMKNEDKEDVLVTPRAFYVTLDESHAVESNPSEINAWKSYNITNLNKVVDNSGSLEITIPSEAAKGDYIGFRVYGVNYDGTLCDPDGRAFYVYVAGKQNENTASLMFKPSEYVANNATVSSDKQALSTAKWSDVTPKLNKIYVSTDSKKADISGDLTTAITLDNFKMYNPSDKLPKTIQEVIALDTKDKAKYTQVYMEYNDLDGLENGVTYVAEIEFTAKDGNQEYTVETALVSFTKVLPTFPSSVKPYTNILVDNTLKIYPKSINGDDALYDIDNVWHGVDAHTAFVQTNVTDKNPQTVIYVPTDVKAEADLSDNKPAFKVDKNIMRTDNAAYKTIYPMAVTYDFGYISRIDIDGKLDGNENDADFITTGTEFNLVFGNYLDDCTYGWNGAAPTLVYPGAVGATSEIDATQFAITDWYNKSVNLWKVNGTAADVDCNGYAEDIQVDLLTGSDFKTVNEYYTAKAEVKSVTSNNQTTKHIILKLTSTSTASQGSDVPTKIRLTIKDIYGGTVVKTFDPFTMKFQK